MDEKYSINKESIVKKESVKGVWKKKKLLPPKKKKSHDFCENKFKQDGLCKNSAYITSALKKLVKKKISKKSHMIG